MNKYQQRLCNKLPFNGKRALVFLVSLKYLDSRLRGNDGSLVVAEFLLLQQ